MKQEKNAVFYISLLSCFLYVGFCRYNAPDTYLPQIQDKIHTLLPGLPGGRYGHTHTGKYGILQDNDPFQIRHLLKRLDIITA